MDAKYVFNSDGDVWAGTIFKMAAMAKAAGYRFFLFNDIVYYIINDELGVSDTGLIRSNIFQYLG